MPPSESDARSLAMFVEARRLVWTRPADPDWLESRPKVDVQPLGRRWWPAPERGRIFNTFGKLVQQREDFGRLRQWTYDASGNLAQHTDFDGGTWSYGYDKWHLLRSLTNPLGAVVRFSYSTAGLLTSADAAETRSEYRWFEGSTRRVRRHGRVRDRYALIGRESRGEIWKRWEALLTLEIGLEIYRSGERLRRAMSTRSLTMSLAAGVAPREETPSRSIRFGGNCLVEKRNGLAWNTSSGVVAFAGEPAFRAVCDSLRSAPRGWQRRHYRPRRQTARHPVWPYGIAERRFSNGSQRSRMTASVVACLCSTALGRCAVDATL